MPLTLDAMHLSRDPNMEVQRANNFEVIIEGLPNIITLAVDSAPLPTFSVDPIELSHGNTKVKVAGAANIEGGDIVVKDLIEVDVEKILEDWFNLVFNPRTGAIGRASDYKKNAVVVMFGPDGNTERTWNIEGVWISSFTPGEMSYEGAEKKSVTCTLSFDNAYRAE